MGPEKGVRIMRKLEFDHSLFKAIYPIQVRFRDTDALRHVNNAVYLSYMELAGYLWFGLGVLQGGCNADAEAAGELPLQVKWKNKATKADKYSARKPSK
jgi:hypothetical protein